MAGSSLRCDRSPLPPKMTSVHGCGKSVSETPAVSRLGDSVGVMRPPSEEIRNPNIEIRNESEYRNENQPRKALRCFFLGIRICFGFRYSDFGFSVYLCFSSCPPNM